MLDVLRGVAILAIFFMNISDMGGSLYAFYGGDPRSLGWSGIDQAAWWLRDVLVSGTARCLLELLFGAGMVILSERLTLRAYAWRNIVLIAFGLVHVFLLLWPGDILHTYGVAALIAMCFRHLPPRLLLTLGLVAATVPLVDGLADAVARADRRQAIADIRRTPPLSRPEQETIARIVAADQARAGQHAARRAAMAARVATEDRARTGTAWSWAMALWGAFFYLQAASLEFVFVWEATSTMLIGAALYKWGIVQGQRGRVFYAGLMATGYAIGLPLRIWGAWAVTRFDHLPSLATAFAEYARLLTTMGHVGLIALLTTGAMGARRLRPFAVAGRTALTLYVLQTIAGLWVLYPPWGFALYGRQGWATLMLTAFAIDAVLLGLAMWWTRRFAIAPVEWAWRSIVAGSALPWRGRAAG